jgi:hypothetical protein
MRLRLPAKSFAVRLRHAAPTFNLEEVRTYDAPADVGGPQERVESDTRANGGRPVTAHTRAGVRLRAARGKSDEAPQPGTGRLEVTKRRRVPVRPFCTTFDQAKNLGLGLGLGWNLNPKPRKR